MKVHRSFLNGISIICLSFFLSFLNCGSDVDVQTAKMQPLTDVLTLELTFGADEEKLKSEYLLARPSDIAINNADDIFVVDEDRVKVYDSSGKEKMIIGGPGEGPGEFISARSATINEEGYLTVGAVRDFSLFDANYNFIKREAIESNQRLFKFRRMENKVIATFSPLKIYSFNETDRILQLDGLIMPSQDPWVVSAKMLFFESPDTIFQIFYYEPREIVSINRSFAGIPFKGRFFYDVLSNNRLIYTNAETDKRSDKNKSEYILHVFSSTDGFESTKIIRAYGPVAIPNSSKEQAIDRLSEPEIGMPEISKEVRNFVTDKIKEIKYFPPVSGLKVDDNLIFVFTGKKNAENHILTEIFDAVTLTYLRSAYFSKYPRIIKNGYAYILATNDEGFYVVEKYRIDPSVYGK